MEENTTDRLKERQETVSRIRKMQAELGMQFLPSTVNLLADLGISEESKLRTVDLDSLSRLVGVGSRILSDLAEAKSRVGKPLAHATQIQKIEAAKILSRKAQDVLFEIGFSPGDDLSRICLVDIVAVPGGGPKVAREILSYRHNQLRRDLELSYNEENTKRLLKVTIAALNPRARKIIGSLQLNDIVEFINVDWETLLTKRQCGRDTFDHIARLQNFLRTNIANHPDIPAETLLRKIRHHPSDPDY